MRRSIFSVLLLTVLALCLAACSESDMVRPDGLKSLYGTPAPGAPGGSNNHVQKPAHPTKTYYVSLARQDAIEAGIDPDCFQRQINQESGFNPDAHGESGEVGIAQFMPETAAGLGINPHDPEQSLRGAAQLMSRYMRNNGGDYRKALASYNAGSGTLAAAIQSCGGAWETCLPRSTQAYIQIAMGG